eukprot:g10396.t1
MHESARTYIFKPEANSKKALAKILRHANGNAEFFLPRGGSGGHLTSSASFFDAKHPYFLTRAVRKFRGDLFLATSEGEIKAETSTTETVANIDDADLFDTIKSFNFALSILPPEKQKNSAGRNGGNNGGSAAAILPPPGRSPAVDNDSRATGNVLVDEMLVSSLDKQVDEMLRNTKVSTLKARREQEQAEAGKALYSALTELELVPEDVYGIPKIKEAKNKSKSLKAPPKGAPSDLGAAANNRSSTISTLPNRSADSVSEQLLKSRKSVPQQKSIRDGLPGGSKVETRTAAAEVGLYDEVEDSTIDLRTIAEMVLRERPMNCDSWSGKKGSKEDDGGRKPPGGGDEVEKIAIDAEFHKLFTERLHEGRADSREPDTEMTGESCSAADTAMTANRTFFKAETLVVDLRDIRVDFIGSEVLSERPPGQARRKASFGGIILFRYRCGEAFEK